MNELNTEVCSTKLVLHDRMNDIMLTWWGIMLDVVGIMLTWWGIMLDVVDTPYRGGVLCLRGGALCSASLWRIHHIKHNTPPR